MNENKKNVAFTLIDTELPFRTAAKFVEKVAKQENKYNWEINTPHMTSVQYEGSENIIEQVDPVEYELFFSKVYKVKDDEGRGYWVGVSLDQDPTVFHYHHVILLQFAINKYKYRVVSRSLSQYFPHVTLGLFENDFDLGELTEFHLRGWFERECGGCGPNFEFLRDKK